MRNQPAATPSPATHAAARAAVREARRIVALTGAGVSAESGLATFRGPGGHWRNHRPEDLATPQAFARDPGLVWEWYAERRGLAAAAVPNPAHVALAALERARPAGTVTLVTQNVDGLHRRAGSAAPIELHGSLWILRCTGCGTECRDECTRLATLPPVCAECGGIERPGVVWFGEALAASTLAAAAAAIETADLVLVAGTSGLVYPAAGLVERAIDRGIPTIEVNPEPTPYSGSVGIVVRGNAGAVLPLLIAD